MEAIETFERQETAAAAGAEKRCYTVEDLQNHPRNCKRYRVQAT